MNGGNDFQGHVSSEIESLYLDGCFQKEGYPKMDGL